MGNNFVRLALAACLSALGLFINQKIYDQSAIDFDTKGLGRPLAILNKGVSTIERRPQKRLMWQPIKQGNFLYQGDAIRTFDKSKGEVRLIDSGMLIGLEPDSVIVLEESKKGLTLDLLAGSLNVKKSDQKLKGSVGSGQKGANAPSIKSGDSQIELKDADTSLSMAVDEAGRTNVSVFSGSATVQGKGGKKMRVDKDKALAVSLSGKLSKIRSIATLSPLPGAVIDLGASRKKKVAFTFVPLGAKGLSYFVEKGAKRNQLKRIPVKEKGKIELDVFFGSFYWRVIALRGGENYAASSTIRVDAEFTFPPEPVSPLPNENISLKKGSSSVVFNWANPGFEKSTLFVAKDRLFNKVIVKKTFKKSTQAKVTFKKRGSYFWRVRGSNKDGGQKDSETRKFLLVEKKELEPPLLFSPVANIQLREDRLKGQALEWTASLDAEAFDVRLAGRTDRILKTEDSRFFLSSLSHIEPGRYKWAVRAIGAEGDKSKWSKSRPLRILKGTLKTLKFLNIEREKFYFKGKVPKVSLKWKRVKDAFTWRFRYAKKEDGIEKGKWRTLRKNTITQKLPSEGAFMFEVMGYDEDKNKVAAIAPKTINIMPYSGPSSLISLVGYNVDAKGDGSAIVEWQPNIDAARYEMTVLEVKTRKMSKKRLRNPKFQLQDLNPGKYEIFMVAFDKDGMRGKKGKPVIVKVPKESSILAPKVNAIQIE